MRKTTLWICSCLWVINPASGEVTEFDKMDANRDGRLSREELPVELRGFFENVDQDGDGFVSRSEDARVRAALKRRGGSAPRAGVERKRDLDYVGKGNPRQKLDLYLPKERTSEPLPVVCWIHGGAWRQGSKDRAGQLERLVASGGYAGVSIGYRLTDEAHWPAQIHDCKAAIRWIRAHAKEYGLDPDRIAVWGASAGGHLVAMLGVSNGDEALEGELGPHTGFSSDVACVVNFFGPSQLLQMDEEGGSIRHSAPNSPESLLVGGPIHENPEVARNASPWFHVSKGDAPMLLVHGTEDRLVPYSQSVKLSSKLSEVGTSAPLLTVEHGGHGQGFGPTVEKEVLQFLGQQLLGKSGKTVSRTIGRGE